METIANAELYLQRLLYQNSRDIYNHTHDDMKPLYAEGRLEMQCITC